MQEWFIQLANNHSFIVYIIIILLACAEGPILSMIFGVLIKLGYFSFLPVYGALMLGDVLGDTGWYYIGRRWGHSFIGRFGKYLSITEGEVEKVTRIFHRYKHSIIFISKISNGLGLSLVTLITAGIVKIPFGRYLFTNLLGQFIWSGALIGIGYFFSGLYVQVDTWMSRMGIVVLFILLIFVLYRYTRYVKSKLYD